MNAGWLKQAANAGVFHLSADARELARAAASAGLMVVYIDIGHAHDRDDFVDCASRSLRMPGQFAAGWSEFTAGLRDMSWLPAQGWALILEKSKHFCGGHGHEFKDTMDAMAGVSAHWRAQGKPFWTLIGGPDGWKSGWPDMPST